MSGAKNIQEDLLGLGVYTLQEAGLYARVSPRKLSTWVFGSNRIDPVIDSQLSQLRLVSFYDLVQAMAVNRAREYGVSLQKIREAVHRAKRDYGVDLPLAHKHKLLLFEKELCIKLPSNQVYQLTGKGRNQAMIQPIVEPFMKDLRFGPDGIAVKYVAYSDKGREIVLDPDRQFGHPLVGSTGYRADVLAAAFEAEQNEQIVADAFKVEPMDVEVAVRYMRSLRTAA